MSHLHFAQHVLIIHRLIKGFSEQVPGLLDLRLQVRDPRPCIEKFYWLIIADCDAFNGHEHYHPGLVICLFESERPSFGLGSRDLTILRK